MRSERTKKLIGYRLERAHNSLSVALALYERGDCLDSVNRLYYACFYAVLAALLLGEYTAKSHAGVRTMFYKHYRKGA